jgi:hypothetical protein
MVRTPLLPIDDYLNMFSEEDGLEQRLKDLFSNPLLKETLMVASKDLLEAFEKNDISEKSRSSEQVKSSLIKYFIRMSTRSTPFGLFSGVSVGNFGDATNVTISDSSKHIKRARPDMEWVYGVIKKLEANAGIRQNLRVRFNDFTYANGSRIDKPNKTLLQHNESEENPANEASTSIRYTAQVKNLEEKNKQFQIYSSIAKEIISENPNVPYVRIDAFLSQLLENEYLLSELRPPLTNVDVLDYVIGILSSIEGVAKAEEYTLKLIEIKKSISEYNSSSIGKGISLYHKTINLMKELFDCKNYLQVDMKTQMKHNVLDSRTAEELEQFVSAMCKISPLTGISDEMVHYKTLFLEKYGYGAEVPVLELLDIDKGLGSPGNYRVNAVSRATPKQEKTAVEHRLTALLNGKIIEALRAGKNNVEITDDDINYIHGAELTDIKEHPMDYLKSFELYLLAHPGCSSTEETPDYYFTIAPAIASNGIGKTFGRFSDLLTEDESSFLKSDFEKLKESFSDFVIAEITELPSRGRLSNVSINESDYDYQISLATNYNADKHVLSVRDLYIGIDSGNNSFYIRSESLNKKVIVTMTSMMNPMLGSGTLRFLREISSEHKINPQLSIRQFTSDQFDYTPRITYGKIIIKPETWVVSRRTLDFHAKDKSNFDNKLIAYIEKSKIPKYVFLNEGDNRLLLDLDNSLHRNEVYNALKKDNAQITFTEMGATLRIML